MSDTNEEITPRIISAVEQDTTTVDQLPNAGALTGTEKIFGQQGEKEKQISTSQIADYSNLMLANNKLQPIINDANYFVSLPNGNYFAIGYNEQNGPGDGSGLHFYQTSIYTGWYVQTSVSYGTGKIFTRNGQLKDISSHNWRVFTADTNVLPQITDCNDISFVTTSRQYFNHWCNAAVLNSPINGGYGIVTTYAISLERIVQWFDDAPTLCRYTRTFQDGKWSTWTKLITEDDIKKLGININSGKNIIFNGNIDNIGEASIYNCAETSTGDVPFKASWYFLVSFIHSYASTYMTQIAVRMTQTTFNSVKIRVKDSNTWGNWSEMPVYENNVFSGTSSFTSITDIALRVKVLDEKYKKIEGYLKLDAPMSRNGLIGYLGYKKQNINITQFMTKGFNTTDNTSHDVLVTFGTFNTAHYAFPMYINTFGNSVDIIYFDNFWI